MKLTTNPIHTDFPKKSIWVTSPKITAIGLWIAALGIFIQAVSGAPEYPTIPPGIPILTVVGLLIFWLARWRWVSIPGLLLAAFIVYGAFRTAGTTYRLQHPQAVGQFIGTLIQLIGLLTALAAGLSSTVRLFTALLGSKNLPQNGH